MYSTWKSISLLAIASAIGVLGVPVNSDQVSARDADARLADYASSYNPDYYQESYSNQVKAREAKPARPLSDYQMCYINYARDPDVEKRCGKVKRAEPDTSDDIVIGSRDIEARKADALLPKYYRYLPPSVTVRA